MTKIKLEKFMEQDLKHNKVLKERAINFINIGVACNCFVLFKELGLLEFLLKGSSIDRVMLTDPKLCSNFSAAYSALVTLEKVNVVINLMKVQF